MKQSKLRFISIFWIPLCKTSAFAVLPNSANNIATSHNHVVLQLTKDDDPINGNPPAVSRTPRQTTPTISPTAAKVAELKKELFALSDRSDRGFQATSTQRKQVKEIIFQLAPLNPTEEPASPYYENLKSAADSNKTLGDTLAGKWTLIYTDAPDITGLDTSRNPFSTARLGRIGQECSPPYIKNVIEWRRPEWARNLPFSGGDDSRVLQKVVTSATASPQQPKIVNLKVAGLELQGASASASMERDLQSQIEKNGLVAGLLAANPLDLKGPLNPPFGQFEVLYLDDELRIIKTYQNYLAVNRRIEDGDEWF